MNHIALLISPISRGINPNKPGILVDTKLKKERHRPTSRQHIRYFLQKKRVYLSFAAE